MDNISEHLDLTVFFDRLPPPPLQIVVSATHFQASHL